MRLIKNIKNSRKVVFDQGKFDSWCVYVIEANGNRKAPFDEEYFSDLQQINYKYTNDKVYNDFILIYEPTNINIEKGVLDIIDKIVETYDDEDKILIEQWFTVIYAGMIAEENKLNAILKKRIKHLGVFQSLVLNMKPKDAATFSKGKRWRELDEIMKQYDI